MMPDTKLLNLNTFMNVQDNARVGDAYMNQVQSFAAYVPYMTCPGNHESA